MNNVVKMPDGLERRAQKIEAALDRQDDANERSAQSDKDWRDATLELAVELAAAKKELPSLQAFGKWCASRFGDNRLPHQDRAALVRWGAEPDETRKMLANENSRSIQGIDARFTKPSKTPKLKAPVDTPKRIEAADVIRAHVSVHGKVPTVQEAMKASGLSRIVVEPALATVKAENRIAPSTHTYTKAQEHHVEARVQVEIKAAMEQLHKTFEDRVLAEFKRRSEILFPRLQERQDKIAISEKYLRDQLDRHAVFTKPEYTDILFCVRNEHTPQDRRDRATIALEKHKARLVGS